jgi:hypothetical protein
VRERDKIIEDINTPDATTFLKRLFQAIMALAKGKST